MPDHFFVYPAYLDRSVSRSLGRRVPAGAALSEVTADEIVQAARGIGFTAEPEPDRQFPPVFHTYAGRVRLVKRAGTSKTRALREIADEIGRRRGAGGRT